VRDHASEREKWSSGLTANDPTPSDPSPERQHDADARDASLAPVARPRGFLLVVVAAMVALAGVIAASQWQIASSASRTGTDMMASIKSRAIADACLEKWLRYAKAGVDDAAWTDFDQLLTPGLAPPGPSDAISDDDFIPAPSGTHCTAGVAYVPSTMRTAAEPARALHRYCAMRMDGGACLVRFDDNSDDGKEAGAGGGVLSLDPIDGTEGPTAPEGDNPRRDRDFSVLVTAIGIFPAKATTPGDDLYHLADARATKRALLQIELQASLTGRPAIHANRVDLENGPGSNWAVKACGTGGISASVVSKRSGSPDGDDGCVCGVQKVGGTNPLQTNCSANCGSDGCAASQVLGYAAPADAIDDDDCHDGLTATGCLPGNGDNEFDADKPPPLPPFAHFTSNNLVYAPGTNFKVAAPAYAFANRLPAQGEWNTRVPKWITGDLPDPLFQAGDPTDPICTYFYGGLTYDKGRVTINNATNAINEVPSSGINNRSPRAVYIWDHSDTDVVDTFLNRWGPAAVTHRALTPIPPPTWLPFVAPDATVAWPPTSAVISCKAWNERYLPPPCEWRFVRNPSGDVTSVEFDVSTCQVPQSLCWRPVSLLDHENDSGSYEVFENRYFLASHGLGSGALARNREPTDEDNGVEVFHPGDGFRVPLVRGPAVPAMQTYGSFCGAAASFSGTSRDDEAPFFSRSFGRWRVDEDMPHDKWSTRGLYMIFDNEGDSSARALTIEAELGSSAGSKLKIGFIVDGPVQIGVDDDRYVCCPTCNCANLGGTPASTDNWGHSSGYFLFARSACGILSAPQHLTGDIACEVVGVKHDHSTNIERAYGDVFSTGACSDWGGPACTLSSTDLRLVIGASTTNWCEVTNIGDLFLLDDVGICIDDNLFGHGASARNSRGPWIGHFWSRRDLVIQENFSAAAPPPADAATTPPYFPTTLPVHTPVGTWPIAHHPEWPVLFAGDDIGVIKDNRVYGKIQSLSDIQIVEDNTIWGRVVARTTARFGSATSPTLGQNYIYWSGSGTSTTSVSDSIFYQDLGW
jgi:hypothetical protein